MDLRSILLHGILYIQDEGILLILYFDGPQRLGCCHLILRYDCTDIITIDTVTVGHDPTLRHILMRRVGRPRMACGRIIMLFLQIEAGEDFYDSRNLLRLGCIN